MAKMQLSKDEVATVIENFVEGTVGNWDGDDFTTGTTFQDDHLKAIQKRYLYLPEEFPSDNPHYCSDEGLNVLRTLVAELRSKQSSA
jgi:hypothetical protein